MCTYEHAIFAHGVDDKTCLQVRSCSLMHGHAQTHKYTCTFTMRKMFAHVRKCVCVRNLWEGIVRHIGQTAEQQWESNKKRRAVKRKSTCSVTVPWTVDQAMCGTWHASEVRIHFEMTRTRNVALCAWAVSHARETLRVKACEVSVLFTHTVAYKRIAISCKRNDWTNWKKHWWSSNFEKVHHVCDPFQSVQDEACEDQESELVQAFHPHCFHSVFCRSSSGLCRIWWLGRIGRLLGWSACCRNFSILFTPRG